MPDEVAVEARLGHALERTGGRVAVAESCTGGLVGSLITDVPGSSGYFVGGIISYMNETKLQRLAVSREALERHGAVSKPVAREMAQHIRDEANATWGLSTTGYAGPDSGGDTPVGTVFVGIAYAGTGGDDESYTVVEHHRFDGDRHAVKAQIARQALGSTLEQIEARG